MPNPDLPAVPTGRGGEELRALAALGTAQLRAELSRALERTAAHLMRLALIVRVLEERGEDLSDLRLGLLPYLRQIAYGRILPEVVVRFAESPALVRTIAALPPPDQRRLAAGEPVPLVVAREGGHDIRMADPLRMTAAQIHQVFRHGRICDESEQLLTLEGRGRKPARRSVGRILVDRRQKGLVVGRVFLTVVQVVEALALLAETDEDADDDSYSSPVVTHLTVGQHDALKAAALRGRTTVTRLVRRALAAYGLFARD